MSLYWTIPLRHIKTNTVKRFITLSNVYYVRRFKGSGHYWQLLKIIISIRPVLVTSNGQLLVVWNIVRNGSLWSDVVFKKEVLFHEFDFETSDLEFEVSKSSIWWKHTTSCDKGVFSFIIISQIWRPIELKFPQMRYFMHMLRYTNCED